VFTASGVQKDRDYFSGGDFERIDTLSGNLVLTFTDLVLPGNGGMDLTFQRTYNRNGSPNLTPAWSFGIAGLPLQVQFPQGPPIFTTPPLYPIVTTGDGAKHQTWPVKFESGTGQPQTQTYITSEFWRYTVGSSSHTLELPNGYQIKYTGVYPAHGLAHEATDAYGNRVEFSWENAPGGGQRLTEVRQYFGESTRTVSLGYATSSDGMPSSMAFAGRTWHFGIENGVRHATSPENTKWLIADSASTLELTTPSGGRIEYTFGTHVLT